MGAWEKHTGRRWSLDEYEPVHRRSSLPWERRGLFEHLLTAHDDMDYHARLIREMQYELAQDMLEPQPEEDFEDPEDIPVQRHHPRSHHRRLHGMPLET